LQSNVIFMTQDVGG